MGNGRSPTSSTSSLPSLVFPPSPAMPVSVVSTSPQMAFNESERAAAELVINACLEALFKPFAHASSEDVEACRAQLQHPNGRRLYIARLESFVGERATDAADQELLVDLASRFLNETDVWSEHELTWRMLQASCRIETMPPKQLVDHFGGWSNWGNLEFWEEAFALSASGGSKPPKLADLETFLDIMQRVDVTAGLMRPLVRKACTKHGWEARRLRSKFPFV